uniref:Phosphatidylinositol-3-phosphatase SAC1 n=1 Tax=Xenopsylla cheopis TaxID=163159 RepID=A0A6M2DXH7_XENCH
MSEFINNSDIHDDMNFYISQEKFYIEPNGKSEVLIIDRVTFEVQLQSKTNQIPHNAPRRAVCGLLGVINLIAGPYLVVATHRLWVGRINGQDIWQLAGSDLIPYARSFNHLSLEQVHLNNIYENMIRYVLDTPRLYFSYTYDVTHTLQRLYNTPPTFLQSSLYERSESRFVWNGMLLKNLYRAEIKKYCLPIMLGFICINQVRVNGHSITWSLISRRCIYRAGTRLFCRGIDEQGAVANFVETEQIMEFAGDRSSFVQTRGSIPLFWNQYPNLKYKPSPDLQTGLDNVSAYTRHIENQIMLYGRQVLVNLIDHRGPEEALEKAYCSIVQNVGVDGVRYESFDFHAECRHMKWDRLNILIDRLAHEQDEFSVFLLRRDGTLISSQDGVFRTNCIDCLDRTNVVQSMLARRALTGVLRKLEVLQPNQSVQDILHFENLFKAVWADNADLVSIQYSGTGALKTDFTRTGKRTRVGLMKDGINSLTRYYMNNFSDGYRQDSIDLFLGNYQVNSEEGSLRRSPLQVTKGWKYVAAPSVLMVAISMFFASAIFPHEYSTEVLLYMLFWGAMIASTFSIIMHYGTEFVDFPKLREEFRSK